MNKQIPDDLTALRESCEQAINFLWDDDMYENVGRWNCTNRQDGNDGFHDMRDIVLRLQDAIRFEIAHARTQQVDALYMATQDLGVREHIRTWQIQNDPYWHPDYVAKTTAIARELLDEILAEEKGD